MLKIATDTLFLDEPCFGLEEGNHQSIKGLRRYQICRVVRNDRLAEAWLDLGAARKFKGVDAIFIIGGVKDEQTGRIYIEHTVGELREMADEMRGNPPFDLRELVGVDKIKI